MTVSDWVFLISLMNLVLKVPNYVYGDFSYTIQVAWNAELSFGLKGGFTNYKLTTPDINDPYFNGNFNSWKPNVGAGFYLSTDRWYVGAFCTSFVQHGFE